MAKKIKIKDLEGDADEIKNLLKDFGCDLNTYINTQPITKKIPDFWLYILIPLFLIVSCLIWVDVLNSTWTKVITLFLFLNLGFIVLIVHYNYNKTAISIITFLIGLCLSLICLNVYTPKEITKKIEEEAISRLPKKNETNPDK